MKKRFREWFKGENDLAEAEAERRKNKMEFFLLRCELSDDDLSLQT